MHKGTIEGKEVMPLKAADDMKKANYFLILMVALSLSISVCSYASASSSGTDTHSLSMISGDMESGGIDDASAFLGIYMDDLTLKMKRRSNYPLDKGVLVAKVIEDSPADEAGLEDGDIIYSFDGKEVEDPLQLSRLVGDKKPNDEVKIVFYRDGKKIETTVELGRRPWKVHEIDWEDIGKCARDIAIRAGKMGRYASRYIKDIFIFKGRLGIEVHDLNEGLAGYFKLSEPRGVLVLDVVEDSPADEAGIKSGDVIVAINGEEVSDIDDFTDKLGDMEFEKGDVVKLTVMRSGRKKTIKLEVTEENFDDLRFDVGPFGRSIRIDIESPDKIIQKHRIIELERDKLRQELKKLKKDVNRIEERLRELEREKK